MARKCEVTKKGVLSGNNVSHSNRKTRRRFLPNIHTFTLFSEVLGKISIKATANGIKTIDHNHGIDEYLLSTPISRLAPEIAAHKRKLQKALEKKQQA